MLRPQRETGLLQSEALAHAQHQHWLVRLAGTFFRPRRHSASPRQIKLFAELMDRTNLPVWKSEEGEWLCFSRVWCAAGKGVGLRRALVKGRTAVQEAVGHTYRHQAGPATTYNAWLIGDRKWSRPDAAKENQENAGFTLFCVQKHSICRHFAVVQVVCQSTDLSNTAVAEMQQTVSRITCYDITCWLHLDKHGCCRTVTEEERH